MGQCDTAVINVVLDEIMRAAVDGGLGSSRCETMVDVLTAMGSKIAKGRILAKLRKVSKLRISRLKFTDYVS